MRARFVAVTAIAAALAACATFGGGDPEVRDFQAGLRSCGVVTRSGQVTYSAPDALLTLSASRQPATVNAGCLARVLIDRGIELKAADLAFAQRYGAALEREYAVLGVRKAKYWLKVNRKAKVPDYAPGKESLGSYVRKLERLCDAPTGSVGTGTAEVIVPWLEGEANNQVSCVYLAALASNLAARGIKLVSLPEQRPTTD
ncbi:hypothetical protein [Novosphingobium sp. Gsoil 351]|uniref:hypothetical protein n=1 Tax=Novosphingobium sp. Gsoil 351 TaxID=2675225 RepID=UPI0012B488B2|nr:hypothetical protein [Novosphingobium sp. Gsoil 351]QGN53641.1 hypothetical protein GKE62_02870 [Novosphingobium sp. Gsoil 351]